MSNNYRDLAIHILSLYGLSIEEIRKLKVDDVELFISENPQVFLHLPSRKITITDLVMVLDLVKCIEENHYIRIYRNNPRQMPYLDSPYLIKQIRGKGRRIGQPIEENLLNSRLEKFSGLMEKMKINAKYQIRNELIRKIIGLRFNIDTYKEDIQKALDMDLEFESDEVYYQLVLRNEDFTFHLSTITADGFDYAVVGCYAKDRYIGYYF